MDELDYWRLCQELSISQAALLIVGVNPSSEEGSKCESYQEHERPRGYEAAKSAVTNELRGGRIKGVIRPQYGHNEYGLKLQVIADSIDIHDSLVDVESLKVWLAQRNIRADFFFPTAGDSPDYLDPNNPRYAHKLAAAVSAWQAVVDPGKKTPKQALEIWLRQHAGNFGLVDADGSPRNQAIEECCKVANWNPGGGAPKTLGD